MSPSKSVVSALQPLASYSINKAANHGITLSILRGSVVDFFPPINAIAAIVNAANTGCLSGGGVDGAITAAGGPALAKDRLELPIINNAQPDSFAMDANVRCPIGKAVITGQVNNKSYGDLKVPFVIHTVGPNYSEYKDENQGHELLKSAYQSALDLADKHHITDVAFSLISAGVYRGNCSRETVLSIAVQSIKEWCNNITNNKKNSNTQATRDKDQQKAENDSTNGSSSDRKTTSVTNISLCAYSEIEGQTLLKICDDVIG